MLYEVITRLDRLLRERAGGEGVQRSADGVYVWQPQADVFESAEELTIQVELAGLSLDDVVLESKGQELLVYGERRFVKDVDGPAYHTLERSFGPFARRFVLPKGRITSYNVCYTKLLRLRELYGRASEVLDQDHLQRMNAHEDVVGELKNIPRDAEGQIQRMLDAIV